MLDSRLVISRARSWLEPRLDRVGFLIAALYALPSLGYVFGRDQAAFQYIGREWLRGSLPFRDMFEIKPPGVYAVHAISILLFGQRQWGIRILELAAILAMSWMLARSLRISGSRRGVAGILAILLAGSYYTLFDYWDSAQAEVWEATALVGAWLVAERVERPARRAALSGMLSACAFVIKFPACLLGLAIGARVVERAWREDGARGAARGLAWHTAAGLAVIGFVLAYFWYYKGLYDLFDVLFGYNAAYARQWATDWPTAKAMTIDWFRRGSWFYGAFLVAWIAGLVMARRTGDTESRRGLSWAMALFLLSYVSMASQRKFFGYHWGVTAPFAALLAAWAVVAFVRRAPFVAYATALSLLVVGFVTAPPWYARRETSYRSYAGAFVGYLRGTLRREEFIDQFTGVYGYVYRAQEAIGEAIRERAVAGDTLLVDGFEPTVYIVSGLRCPCRFFVSHHLADERLVYKHRARWIERQEEQLARRPPRFFVTFSEQQLGTRGYRLLRRELHHFLGERIY